MTEAELAQVIEASKQTVLRAIQSNLPGEQHASVEDVAQETYLRYFLAFRNKQALQGDDLQRWLYVAARNECRRAARKNRREGFALFRFDWTFRKSSLAIPDSAAIESESGEFAESKARVRLHVDRMPEPFREATLLRLKGMKMAEIARSLGISAGTVKSRLARGREWLARYTNANANEEGRI
ncbi:MAG: RNA polymerase sigma factor [Spirochaetia bacterium]|nr:RNA polymerase sigma factor [Spirochaetia bacterium]